MEMSAVRVSRDKILWDLEEMSGWRHTPSLRGIKPPYKTDIFLLRAFARRQICIVLNVCLPTLWIDSLCLRACELKTETARQLRRNKLSRGRCITVLAGRVGRHSSRNCKKPHQIAVAAAAAAKKTTTKTAVPTDRSVRSAAALNLD